MDKFNRAVRRHHSQRLKKVRSQTHWFWGVKTERQLGKLLHTPRMCSCWMCGNARKYYGHITIQELKHLEKFDYELLENSEA